jgi:hypothetical protein
MGKIRKAIIIVGITLLVFFIVMLIPIKSSVEQKARAKYDAKCNCYEVVGFDTNNVIIVKQRNTKVIICSTNDILGKETSTAVHWQYYVIEKTNVFGIRTNTKLLIVINPY